MATDNVEFYERMQKLQAVQQQREQQRMSLEQEFNSYLKSDKRLNKVRASKLQSYWTKICEDERRSRARNEQLLREYDRVEAHVAALSARTDRLRLLKDQYEKQVEMMYPRWQEQVEIKRRQQLLQQQREQQQLAQQLQQLQQQQQSQGQQQPSQGQQQPLQQQTQQQEQHYLPQHQVHKQEQYPSAQVSNAMNLDNYYNHLRRPLIPNSHVQTNSPPILTSGEPRYASVQFGTQPTNLAYRIPTTGQGHSSNLQEFRDTGSYEVPSGGSTFGMSQPRVPNGLQNYGQQGSSSMPHAGAATEGFSLHAPPLEPDAGYTRLHTGIQGLESDPSARHPSSSLMYSEVKHGGIAGSTHQSHSQGIPHNLKAQSEQMAPALPHGDTTVDNTSGSDSYYQKLTAVAQASRVPRNSTAAQVQSAPQAIKETVTFAQDDDNDSIVTPLNDEDLYLVPEPIKSAREKVQLKSSEGLKPLERASSSVSAKAVSTARTDPFTSEDEDDEEDNEETEALRDVLQRQLRLGDDAASEKRQTALALDKGQSITKQGELEQGLNKEREVNLANEGPPKLPVISGVQQPREIPKLKVQEDEDDEAESESDSEIGSDMSLPLSDTGGDKGPGPGISVNKPAVRDQAQQARSQSNVAEVTVTEQGFWQLVSAVEQEIEQSDNIEKIYNLPVCTTAIKTEIVKTANSNDSLDHLNPHAISMVVLEQLQQLVCTLPGSCLLSDKLLDTKRAITEVTIRSFLYSSALGFWDKLLQHLVLLIMKGVMDAEEVASLIAPLLISPDSAFADKAVDALRTVLQDIEQQEDSQLDDTYSTLPSASATPSHLSMPHQDETGTRHQGHPEVPPLDLRETMKHETPELETDRVSHDSFFDEPAVPLTETKAYQQMMQSSQGLAKPTSQDGEGDGDDNEDEDGDEIPSDDEIERATRLSPETPPSSRNKKRRNVLSSLGGSGSLGISYGNDDEDAGGGAGRDGGETKRSEQMSDLISSPSPSPSPKGSPYVPSAMEQSLKSSGRSEPMQRSAAFWGEESDMEESEMSVPMGTGTLKSDDFKDDFDFYD